MWNPDVQMAGEFVRERILMTNVQYNFLGMTGRHPAAVRNLCIILGIVNSSF
jgi:hypothetical protein